MFGTIKRHKRPHHKDLAKTALLKRAIRHLPYHLLERLEARQLLAAADPIINEFMTSNKTGITDPCGQTADWIEIYNGTGVAVNMAGWHLTDDITIPDRWTFPTVNINSNGYLVVWASDCALVDPARPTANFKLDPDGEYLALTRPDNSVVTEFNPTYPSQLNDTSYGLSSTGVYQYMSSETPGTANIDGATGLVADTAFNVDRGIFTAPFQLTISTTTPGATIRYTTNGTPPTATTGTVYTTPINIDHTTTIRAAAFKTGFLSSNTDTQTYLFLNDVIHQPNLPITSITRVGTTATVTTSVPHGFSVGNTVLIYGATQTQYNTQPSAAPFAILSVPSPTTFTYTVSSAAPTPATGANMRVANPAGYPGSWGFYNPEGTPNTADYEMDPDVVNNAAYVNQMIDALTSIPTLSIVLPISDLFNNTNSPNGTGGIYSFSGAATCNVGCDPDIPLRNVASIVRNGSVATATSAGHGYVNGDRIWIQNANQAAFNGTFTIFGVTASTFQYSVPTTAPSNATGTIFAQRKNNPQLWERPASVEWINPDGSNGFQINAGLQIQGNASREPNKSGKHSFRLLFKTQYGASHLDYPVFGDDVPSEFDSLILKAGFNNSWIHWDQTQRSRGTLISDRWASETQLAMGDVAKHGQFVQLYLNGIYWGVYDVMERPEASFAAQNFGGDADDYDTINNEDKLIDGNRLAWDQMFNLVNSTDLSQAANYNAVKPYLDMPSFVDYMLLNYYDGNQDWDDHNWYATRHSRLSGVPSNVDGFHFYSYDSENILNDLTHNVTAIDNDKRPTRLFQRLKNNLEFRQLVADRAHFLFFNNGPLTPTAAADRYRKIMALADPAVIAESARWGDYRLDVNHSQGFNGTAFLYTRNDYWVPETNRILSSYFPLRTNAVLNQLRTLNLYPNMDAPEFNQFGGTVNAGFQLNMTNVSGGTVYYTLDGADPRLVGGAISAGAQLYTGPVTLNASARILARVYNPTTRIWSALTDFTFHVVPMPALRITEVMYNPRKPSGSLLDDDEFQFIELQNTGATPINLNGIVLKGVNNFVFPNTVLDPGARTLLVANQAAFESLYGLGKPIAGVFTGRLSHNGEKITLQTPLGGIIEQFSYKDGWYGATDGQGYSLVAVDPNASNDVLNTQEGWRASTPLLGAPGDADPGLNNNSIVFNEVLSNTAADPFIEFKNSTNADIDISGWYLTDDEANRTKYTIPGGSIVPASGYLTLFQSTSFGGAFQLKPAGGILDLANTFGAGLLGGYRDGVDFAAADPEVSFGRYIKSTGGSDFTALTATTPGAANAAPVVGPIVINEVMYNAFNSAHEFVEIKNISGSTVALNDGTNGWAFTSGISYIFGVGAALAAGEIALVVPIDPTLFRTKYSIPASVQIFGPYTGHLSDNGEKLAIGKPVALPPAPPTPLPYIQVDRVNYNDSGAWPIFASGMGSSLQREVDTDYTNDVANWGPSAPGGTPGAANDIKSAPTVNAGPDTSINEASSFTLNGSFTDPDASETWTATVNWGDTGSSVNLPLNANKTFSLAHPYADSGVYTVTVTVTDNNKLFGVDTITLTVNNVIPNGTTSGTVSVNEGVTANVSILTRTDVSTTDTTAGFFYNFDFDNDGTFEVVNSLTLSASVPGTYMDGPGVRPIRIRIIDKDGGFRDLLQNITVNNNIPPTASFVNGGNVNEGAASATVTFSIVNDVLADVASIRYAYDLDNDGTFDIGDGTYAGSAGNTKTTTLPASLLAESGTRSVRGRVMDKDGGVNTYTTIILVNNVAPTATISNTGPANEGSSTTTVSLSNILDTPGDTAAGFTFNYDFDNDGTFDLTGSTSSSATIPASFLSDGPATRSVRIRIVDRDGGVRDYTTPITVNNIAPTIAAIAGKTVGIGAPLNITGSVSDPGSADTFTGTIDYGDGAGLQPLTINPNRTFNLNGSYANPGNYTATVRVTDKDGAQAAPITFNVSVRGSSLSGTASNDTWYIRLDSSQTYVEFYENTAPPGAPTFVIPLASMSNISIDGGGGDDILTIDYSNSNPVPSGGVSYAAGAPSASDTIRIVGDGGIAVTAAPATTVGNGALTISGRTINYTGVEVMNVEQLGAFTLTTPAASDNIFISRLSNQTDISGASGGISLPAISLTNTIDFTLNTAANDAGAGDDSISISSTVPDPLGPETFFINAGAGNNTLTLDGATTNLDTSVGAGGANLAVTLLNSSVVNFTGPQNLKSLTLNGNSRVNVFGSGNLLRLGGLSLASGAKLELDGNDMVVQATAATRQSLLASIGNWLRTARSASPRWAGNGIASAAAAGDPKHITGLAAILNDGDGEAIYATFDGQSVDTNSILVKYTYEGDANVDGQVNADDYAAIDSGFAIHATGYANGDFNYSGGQANSDDYFIIDHSFSDQGAVLGGSVASITPQAPLAEETSAGTPVGSASADAPTAPVSSTPSRSAQSTTPKRNKHRHHKRAQAEDRVWTKSSRSDALTRFLFRF